MARAFILSTLALACLTTSLATRVQPTVALADDGAVCGAGIPGDIDGNGVGDLVVRSWQPAEHTDFEVVQFPGQQRQVVGVQALDPQAEPSVTLEQVDVADLDGDGCSDAVFGGHLWPTVGQDRGTKARLYVVPGSPTGLMLDRATRVDLDGDAIRHIAILPGKRKVAATTYTTGRGALHVITLNAQLAPSAHTVVRGADLKVKSAGMFGAGLAADGDTVAVGSPEELIDRTGVRGAVYLFSATTMKYTRIHQRSKGIYTRWGADFGMSVALLDGRLVIGSPGADVGNTNDAGRVYLVRWNEAKRTYSAVRSFSQATKGVPGTARDWDILGVRVTIARGLTGSGSYDVAASATYDQLGNVKTAGSVTITNFDKGGYRLITQNSPGVPGVTTTNGMFGIELAVRHDGQRTSALVVCTGGGQFDNNRGYAVLQANPGQLQSWSMLQPSTPADRTFSWGNSLAG